MYGLYLLGFLSYGACRQQVRPQDLMLQPGMGKFVMYQKSSEEALSQLKKYIESVSLPLPLLDIPALSHPNRICFGIQTSNRPHSPFKYLLQIVAALLTRMNYRKHKNDVYMHVFNMEAKAGDHRYIHLIKGLLPITHVHAEIPSLRGKKAPESADRPIVLRHLLNLGCKNPILIEDDALPEENWVHSVNNAISQLLNSDWFIINLSPADPIPGPPLSRKESR